MPGWIAPAKDDTTTYPLNNNTFYITTESATGGSDKVGFKTFPDNGFYITNIMWRFEDWGYIIQYCTPKDYLLKFPVTPPGDANKTWEIIVTTEDVKIKCNTLEVLRLRI